MGNKRNRNKRGSGPPSDKPPSGRNAYGDRNYTLTEIKIGAIASVIAMVVGTPLLFGADQVFKILWPQEEKSLRPQLSVQGGDEVNFRKNLVGDVDVTIDAKNKADVRENLFNGAAPTEQTAVPLIDGGGIKLIDSGRVTVKGFHIEGFTNPIESANTESVTVENNVIDGGSTQPQPNE